MKVDKYKNAKGKYDSIATRIYFLDAEYKISSIIVRCRPYIFKREKFISQTDIEENELEITPPAKEVEELAF